MKSTTENGSSNNNNNHGRQLIKSENSLSRNIKHTKRSRGNIKFGDKIIAEERNDDVDDIVREDNYNTNDNNANGNHYNQKKKKKVKSDNYFIKHNYNSSNIEASPTSSLPTSTLSSGLHAPESILPTLST